MAPLASCVAVPDVRFLPVVPAAHPTPATAFGVGRVHGIRHVTTVFCRPDRTGRAALSAPWLCGNVRALWPGRRVGASRLDTPKSIAVPKRIRNLRDVRLPNVPVTDEAPASA
jgi:hypothetical protein